LLKEYQGRWYIIGQINNSEQFRTFGLDRLEDVKVKTETYKALKNFDAKTLFNDVVGLVYTETDTEEVVFTATPLQSKYLIALPLHHSQKLLSETSKKPPFH
jgi:proteasome accessory factor B